MRKLTTALVAGTAITFSGAALAQEEGEEPHPTYIIEGTMSDTKLVSGLGEDNAYLSASWNEKLTIKRLDGSVWVELNSRCVGMGQPDGDLFDRHVACTHDNGQGSDGAVIMGCGNHGGGEMSCMGRFNGKTGSVKGNWAMMVVHYKWDGDSGTVNGSGYWQGGGDDEEEASEE